MTDFNTNHFAGGRNRRVSLHPSVVAKLEAVEALERKLALVLRHVDLREEHIDWEAASAGTIHTDNYIEGGDGTDGTAIHDDTASEISAITEKVSPVSGDLLLIEDSADSNNKKRVQVGNLPSGGGGETNTASNVGAGVGVFSAKSGVDLEFHSLVGATGITVALDGPNDEIDISTNDSAIDHDALLNFSAAVHFTEASIDHTAITNIGSNSHATIDAHLAATAAHGATGAVVGTTNAQTLTNKTLTTPTVADFTNATHDHSNAAGGGSLAEAAVTEHEAALSQNYLDASAAAGSTAITSTTVVPIDNEDVESSSGDFTVASDEITFVNSGTYFVLFSMSSDVTGTTRSITRCWLQTYNGSTWTTAARTIGNTYNRTSAAGEGQAVSHMLVVATGGTTKVRAQAATVTGADTILIDAQCAWSIFRVSA